MKLKYVILGLILILFATGNVTASNLSNYLPGGKNYLEFDNFNINQDRLSTIDSIYVKGDTEYTISFPGEGLIERPEVTIESSNYLYFDDLASSINDCSVSMEYTICTFTTTSTTSYIDISITADGMALYYNYYDMDEFQLEEGSSRTVYEEYIIPFVDANSPEFTGAGAYITSYYDSYSLAYIIGQHIVVIDDIDGNITDQIEIVSDEYTQNMNSVGEYLVELKATDIAGNSAYFDLTIIVKDEVAPIITGNDVVDISVETTKTLEQIINENYVVTDGHDSNLEINIIVDNYTANKDQLGLYTVSLQTEDFSSNETIKSISINVIDNISPELVSSSNIVVLHSNPKTITEIIDALIFTDNYDLSSSLSKEVLADNFSAANMAPGDYFINLLVSDSSGNNIVVDINIEITDDIYPTITGPVAYSYSYTNPHSLNDILSLLQVNDNYDILTNEDITITSDTFSNRTSEVGVYYINIEVEDASFNKTTHQIEVTIMDDQAPIIYVDNVFITLSENATFNEQDALNVMIKNREIPDQNYEVEVIKDEYSGNEEIPGIYLYTIKFTDEDGSSLLKDFVIEVPEGDSLIDKEYLVRNIIVYTVSVSFVIAVIVKTKK
ncbi:hypothetical protein KQ51_01061 [Candidatus Izimaplasma bacterium HR1]|jgi:hypothetical protein|uniref:hypothetical protein n=1 Tax=Candidatus Izimoplasma sp. HR1 TaxID=1541959 RepID=UPI0004F92CA2|nr:hypothetical protein KQ51_01061 [Candidatus Izimaplasma bacterium HR1]